MKRQSQFVNFEIGIENRRFPEKYVPNAQILEINQDWLFIYSTLLWQFDMIFKNQNSELFLARKFKYVSLLRFMWILQNAFIFGAKIQMQLHRDIRTKILISWIRFLGAKINVKACKTRFFFLWFICLWHFFAWKC